MKKMNTIFKTMLFAAVVLVMAQSCIPNVPGGNPTPNPNSQITYMQFNQSLEDSIPESESITIDFDVIKPIILEKNRNGLIYLTDVSYNIIHDSTTEILVKRATTTDIIGVQHYSTNYVLALNTKVNVSNLEWNNGLSHKGWAGIAEQGINTSGINDLYVSVYQASGIDNRYWSFTKQTQNFYIAFRAPLISNPSKFAYGWLQLKPTLINEGNGIYKLISLQLIDAAIETNVGEIYTGNH